MIFEKEFKKYGLESFIAYSGSDITDKMINECFEIDKGFYNAKYSIESSQIREIIKKYGQICFVIVEKTENKVIGYSYWIPIKTSVFLDFIKKEEMLLNLEISQCSSFNEPEINLFSAGEAFLRGYDLQNLHKCVEDLFLNKILTLAEKGIKIKYVALEGVCSYDNEFLAPKLGLSKGVKKGNSLFYCDKYSPDKLYSDSPISKKIAEYYK